MVMYTGITLLGQSRCNLQGCGFPFPQVVVTLVNVSKIHLVVYIKHIQVYFKHNTMFKVRNRQRYLSDQTILTAPFKEIFSFSDMS
jgi:hypothetical protein